MKKPTITSTAQIVHNINAVVYGASGIGKTVLCATAPSPIILSAEGGLLSLAEPEILKQYGEIPVIEINNVDEVNEAFEWLEKSKEAKKYQTICVDSLSELAEKLLVERMEANKDGRAAYGEMANLMTLSIRGFRDLPFHTVFTAKEKKVTEEATGVTTFQPSVPGQVLLNNLPYFFDEVFRMDYIKVKGNQFRALYTEGTRRFVAKDRSGKLAVPVEQPNLTTVFNKILSKPSKPQEGK